MLKEMRALLLTAALMHCAFAHSRLTDPKPDNHYYCALGGENTCAGPCVPETDNPEWKYKLTGVAQNAPAATWARGENVDIEWERNNHRDGFVRLSLVPVENRMSKESHEKYAFDYSCWGEGIHQCEEGAWNSCGSDKTNQEYKKTVRVPKCVPDGIYVLGWVWWGEFEDFYSCSYIEINGGPQSNVCDQVAFTPGKTELGKVGTCHSFADALETCNPTCNTNGVRPRPEQMIPKTFQGGQAPVPISIVDYGGNSQEEPSTTAPEATSATTASTAAPNQTAPKATTATTASTTAPDQNTKKCGARCQRIQERKRRREEMLSTSAPEVATATTAGTAAPNQTAPDATTETTTSTAAPSQTTKKCGARCQRKQERRRRRLLRKEGKET